MKDDHKVYYKDLFNFEIEKIIISSLDQSLYQALLVVGDKEFLIWDTKDKPLATRSLMAMQKAFAGFDMENLILRQESAYDEMVGLSGSGSNRMEVDISRNPYI